jgi:hypothetical protein
MLQKLRSNILVLVFTKINRFGLLNSASASKNRGAALLTASETIPYLNVNDLELLMTQQTGRIGTKFANARNRSAVRARSLAESSAASRFSSPAATPCASP